LAEADGAQCVKLMPEWSKGYVRQATALFYQKKYKDAVLVYAQGLARDPNSRLLADGLASAQKHMSESATDAEDQEVVIGIDLGTTYSCVGVWQNNTVVMVPNDRGMITTPSYVNFTDTGKRSVGAAAKNLAARYPESTLYDVKRFIGQRFEDEGVSQDISRLTYKVEASEPNQQGGGKGQPLIRIDMGMVSNLHMCSISSRDSNWLLSHVLVSMC
jgi:L1 cell adhesion molecule like protein